MTGLEKIGPARVLLRRPGGKNGRPSSALPLHLEGGDQRDPEVARGRVQGAVLGRGQDLPGGTQDGRNQVGPGLPLPEQRLLQSHPVLPGRAGARDPNQRPPLEIARGALHVRSVRDHRSAGGGASAVQEGVRRPWKGRSPGLLQHPVKTAKQADPRSRQSCLTVNRRNTAADAILPSFCTRAQGGQLSAMFHRQTECVPISAVKIFS